VLDLDGMPATMKRLALAQFFTWSALFIMWIFTTPVVAQRFFGATDAASPAFNDGADWVGVLFAIYSGVAALAAFALPVLARGIGARNTHILCLALGAAGYASFLVLGNATALIGSMVLVGIAWASILTMPYVILCDTLPQRKLGIYMGLFNIFIVLPQLIVSSVMGPVVKAFFPDDPAPVMLIAAAVMGAAALAMLRLPGHARADEPGPAALARG
jgi:maltose/moltooligosaccharide transporter